MAKIEHIRTTARKYLPNIILLAATLLICLVFAEILLRFIVPLPESCQLYEKDEALIYKNRPNINYTAKTSEFLANYATNQEGLREVLDYRNNKHDGEFCIFTVGDSFTYGIGLNSEDTFQKKLQRKLIEAYDREVFVINAGVSGYGTKQASELLKSQIAAYKPDIVIFGFYNNDITDDINLGSTIVEDGCLVSKDINPVKKFLYRNSRTYLLYQAFIGYVMYGNQHTMNFLYSVRNVLVKINLAKKATLVYPILYSKVSEDLEQGWQESLNNIDSMERLCEENNCTFVLVYIPSKFQVNPEYRTDYIERNRLDIADFDIQAPSRILSGFCEENGIIFVDLLEEFSKAGIDDTKTHIYWAYDTHFNEKGSEAVSSILFNRIGNISKSSEPTEELGEE